MEISLKTLENRFSWVPFLSKKLCCLLQIKLGPSLFIPNSQIGTFGAVTQFKSLVKNNTDMFDVSFSGPAAALVTAVGLFVAGLVLSSGGDIPKASTPTQSIPCLVC